MSRTDLAAPLRILVVDDDDAVREALGLSLETLGYHVSYAHDGQSALVEIDLTRPEAVVTDLQMPGMNGMDLLRELSRRNLGVPVIAVSGGDTAVLESARRLGAVETFSKPVMDIELVTAIERYRPAARR